MEQAQLMREKRGPAMFTNALGMVSVIGRNRFAPQLFRLISPARVIVDWKNPCAVDVESVPN
jgi:hypothetical protein